MAKITGKYDYFFEIRVDYIELITMGRVLHFSGFDNLSCCVLAGRQRECG